MQNFVIIDQYGSREAESVKYTSEHTLPWPLTLLRACCKFLLRLIFQKVLLHLSFVNILSAIKISSPRLTPYPVKNFLRREHFSIFVQSTKIDGEKQTELALAKVCHWFIFILKSRFSEFSGETWVTQLARKYLFPAPSPYPLTEQLGHGIY